MLPSIWTNSQKYLRDSKRRGNDAVASLMEMKCGMKIQIEIVNGIEMRCFSSQSTKAQNKHADAKLNNLFDPGHEITRKLSSCRSRWNASERHTANTSNYI